MRKLNFDYCIECGDETVLDDNNFCPHCAEDGYTFEMFEDEHPGYCRYEGGRNVMAMSIKNYSGVDVDDENLAESIWLRVQEQFFDDAAETARNYGYSGNYVTGRSGGWMYPYINNGPGMKDKYPSFESRSDVEEFMNYVEDIEMLLDSIPQMIEDEIEFWKDMEDE